MDFKIRKKVMYAILKEIDRGNTKFIGSDFDLTDKEYYEIIGLLSDENYIKGAIPISVVTSTYKSYIVEGTKITSKGMKYLEENSTFGKGYTILKEFRKWL